MKLIYETRGGASPQGKPRVWYTGHPADQTVYAKEIYADLFQTQNCAIYSDAEPDAPYAEEALFHELEQMQIFVFPVTERFLYQPNRAREVEFGFALKHHIPMLPLLQEQGLERDFNEICGDLQMLNKNDTDPTALPYAEKLKKFLDSVLVGGEMAAKIRAAFDAYVFLSYRKKDRRYAGQLMRLIHKNDFCRDIAIWYDEFLIPGENFNQAIAEALQKCSLFTLAVTPNVIEPNNYVMALEYPEAKKAGKPVLPVELVPTDKKVLNHLFEDLPPCTDAHDEAALSETLLTAVRRLAITKNDGEPEHNFFIGLAYLNGIDVEVDRTRALNLITEAAECGLPEAMEKLVEMYRNGEGAARDYLIAVAWQERLTVRRQNMYEQDGNVENGLVWAASLWKLGNYRQELADLIAARDDFEQMNRLCGQLLEAYGTDRAKSYLADSEGGLGDVRRQLGEMSGAEKHYLREMTLRKEILASDETTEAFVSLSACYGRLTELYMIVGKLAEAKEYCTQDLEGIQRLVQQTDTPEAKRRLAACYLRMGEIADAEGDFVERFLNFYDSFDILEQLAQELKTVAARREFSACCGKLGNLSRYGSDAHRFYGKQYELCGQLLEETGTISAKRDFAASCGGLEQMYQLEEEFGKAREYGEKELRMRKQLWEKTGTIDDQRGLLFGCLRMAALLSESGKYAEAEQQADYSRELAARLFERLGTQQAMQDLVECLKQLGDIYHETGNQGKAEQLFLQALELSVKLCEQNKTIAALRGQLRFLERLSTLCSERKDFSGMGHYSLNCLKLRREIFEQSYIPADWEKFLDRWMEILEEPILPQDQMRAAECFMQGFARLKEMWSETQAPEFARYVITGNLVLAPHFAKQGQQDKARYLRCLDEALEMFEWLPGKERTREARDHAALCSLYKAQCLPDADSSKYVLLDHAIRLWQELEREKSDPDILYWQKMKQEEPDNTDYTARIRAAQSLLPRENA